MSNESPRRAAATHTDCPVCRHLREEYQDSIVALHDLRNQGVVIEESADREQIARFNRESSALERRSADLQSALAVHQKMAHGTA